jgi:RNA polymerase sigma-70 factor (ECF subfamily)
MGQRTGPTPTADARDWFLHEYEARSRRLYLVAYGILRDADEARDVVQEAALRVYQRLDVLHDAESVGGYLVTTVRNMALDLVRKAARRRTHNREDVDMLPAEEPPAGAGKDELEQLEEAFVRLSVDYREVLYLRYKEALNAKQIAERLGITHVNARARLSRAHRSLRRELEELTNA